MNGTRGDHRGGEQKRPRSSTLSAPRGRHGHTRKPTGPGRRGGRRRSEVGPRTATRVSRSRGSYGCATRMSKRQSSHLVQLQTEEKTTFSSTEERRTPWSPIAHAEKDTGRYRMSYCDAASIDNSGARNQARCQDDTISGTYWTSVRQPLSPPS